MRKSDKKPKCAATDDAYIVEPWSCSVRDGTWQLDAYSIVSGKREVVAQTFSSAGFSAEAVAGFILRAINNITKRESLIDEMEAALEICLECEGLTWSAEHDAEIALRHARLRT